MLMSSLWLRWLWGLRRRRLVMQRRLRLLRLQAILIRGSGQAAGPRRRQRLRQRHGRRGRGRQAAGSSMPGSVVSMGEDHVRRAFRRKLLLSSGRARLLRHGSLRGDPGRGQGGFVRGGGWQGGLEEALRVMTGAMALQFGRESPTRRLPAGGIVRRHHGGTRQVGRAGAAGAVGDRRGARGSGRRGSGRILQSWRRRLGRDGGHAGGDRGGITARGAGTIQFAIEGVTRRERRKRRKRRRGRSGDSLR